MGSASGDPQGVGRPGYQARRRLRVPRGGRRRGRPDRPFAGEVRPRLQHLQHSTGAGACGLRRSSGGALEEVHLRPLRRRRRPPEDVFRGGGEHPGGEAGVACGGAGDRGEAVSGGELKRI